MNPLSHLGNIPVSYSQLAVIFGNYRSPKDFITKLEKFGYLIRLKRGLYVVSPQITNRALSMELIANHLYGPSYVSAETALSKYGLIPERVTICTSVTPKRMKRYENPIGFFEYITVPDEYFSIGIRQKQVRVSFLEEAANTKFSENEFAASRRPYYRMAMEPVIRYMRPQNELNCFLIASPEKALCDLILTKSGVRLQSVKAVKEFLFEDLRFDMNDFKNPDISVFEQCSISGYKQRELKLLTEYFRNESGN